MGENTSFGKTGGRCSDSRMPRAKEEAGREVGREEAPLLAGEPKWALRASWLCVQPVPGDVHGFQLEGDGRTVAGLLLALDLPLAETQEPARLHSVLSSGLRQPQVGRGDETSQRQLPGERGTKPSGVWSSPKLPRSSPLPSVLLPELSSAEPVSSGTQTRRLVEHCPVCRVPWALTHAATACSLAAIPSLSLLCPCCSFSRTCTNSCHLLSEENAGSLLTPQQWKRTKGAQTGKRTPRPIAPRFSEIRIFLFTRH